MNATPDWIETLTGYARGDAGAVEALFPQLYESLRSLVRKRMRRDGDLLLDSTDFLHEIYLKLVDQSRATYANRVHFLAIAAQALRRLVVDEARRAGAQKRGGEHQRTRLDSKLLEPERPGAWDALDVEDALRALALEDERAARLVEMRFFGGLTMQEAADALQISMSSAERDWRFARAFLFRRLSPL